MDFKLAGGTAPLRLQICRYFFCCLKGLRCRAPSQIHSHAGPHPAPAFTGEHLPDVKASEMKLKIWPWERSAHSLSPVYRQSPATFNLPGIWFSIDQTGARDEINMSELSGFSGCSKLYVFRRASVWTLVICWATLAAFPQRVPSQAAMRLTPPINVPCHGSVASRWEDAITDGRYWFLWYNSQLHDKKVRAANCSSSCYDICWVCTWAIHK